MMRIIDLALKDLSQILRDRKVAALLVLMPIGFTIFFSMLFGGGGGGGEAEPRLPIGWIDRDIGSASSPLLRLLEASDAVRIVVPDEKGAQTAVDQVLDGKLAAVVTVPADFQQSLWTKAPAKLQVTVDENSAAGQTAYGAIDVAAGRLLGAVESARLSAEAFETSGGFSDDASRQVYLDEAFSRAINAWQTPPFTLAVEQASAAAGEGDGEFDGNAQASPGLLVQFAIWSLIMSGSTVVLERTTGAMQRLLTTPIQRWQIIAGHALGMFALTFAQELLLLAFGQFALGVDYLRQPVAILLVALALALWVVGLGMLIGALAETDTHVMMYSLLAMFLFTGLGGAWFPLEGTGAAFQAIGRLTPTYWAMLGFQNVILRGMGLSSVLTSAAILLAYAVLFFGLAVWRFRFE
jgi:ABC-2 type transport system permease protein